MLDQCTAPYAALFLRLSLSFFFFAHLYRKFLVNGFDPWWSGLVKQGYSEIPYPSSQPKMYSPWILLAPECLYWSVRNVVDLWKIPAIYITENGTSSDDVINSAGRVDDIDRSMDWVRTVGRFDEARQRDRMLELFADGRTVYERLARR